MQDDEDLIEESSEEDGLLDEELEEEEVEALGVSVGDNAEVKLDGLA